MMCALLLRASEREKPPAGFSRGRASAASRACCAATSAASTGRCEPALVMLICSPRDRPQRLSVRTPSSQGLLPAAGHRPLIGGIQADQSISFQAMQQKLRSSSTSCEADPAVDTVVGFTGGGQTNSGFMFVSLKPLAERKISADR
jgi:multidrug efflux pump